MEGGGQSRGFNARGGHQKTMLPEDTSPNTIPEGLAAERLGITKATVAQLRDTHLKEGEHWERKKRAVLLTQAGWEALSALVGLQEKSPAAPGFELEELVVWRARSQGLKNPRVVECFRPDKNGDMPDPRTTPDVPRLIVKVRDNSNYWMGQKICARKLDEHLYEHWDKDAQTAARPPREKGRL